MKQNPQAVGGDDDLKRSLMRRVAFAGLLIAMLLGALALVDYIGRPDEEVASSGPTFTAPVPVAKKDVSQPVKAADPVPEPPPAKEGVPPAAVESTAAVPAPPVVADMPARPEVAAQPALPTAQGRVEARPVPPAPARTARSPEPATPAEGTAAASAQFSPEPAPAAEPARPAATVLPAAAPPPPPPAPPRLFSGYAVQAGVFADAQHAEELRARLTLNGIPSTLEARVQVGPFKTREEAEAARQKLKAIGVEGILLPPRGARR